MVFWIYKSLSETVFGMERSLRDFQLDQYSTNTSYENITDDISTVCNQVSKVDKLKRFFGIGKNTTSSVDVKFTGISVGPRTQIYRRQHFANATSLNNEAAFDPKVRSITIGPRTMVYKRIGPRNRHLCDKSTQTDLLLNQNIHCDYCHGYDSSIASLQHLCSTCLTHIISNVIEIMHDRIIRHNDRIPVPPRSRQLSECSTSSSTIPTTPPFSLPTTSPSSSSWNTLLSQQSFFLADGAETLHLQSLHESSVFNDSSSSSSSHNRYDDNLRKYICALRNYFEALHSRRFLVCYE